MESTTDDDPSADGLRTFALAGVSAALLLVATVAVSHPRHTPPVVTPRQAPIVARVTRADGATDVRPGDACELALVAVTNHPSLNCHVTLRCGDALLYGGTRTGYTRCAFDDGRAVTASDPSSADGDPALDVDLRARTARVSHSSPQPWSVELTVDP